MVLCWIPVSANAGPYKDNLRSTVDQQVRAVTRSIYYANADDDAALALAKHGISNRNTLKAGKTHPLTVTLFNSELLQELMTETLTALICTTGEQGFRETFLHGHAIWKNGSYSCRAKLTTIDGEAGKTGYLTDKEFLGKKNSFDSSLEWMASIVVVDFYVERTKITSDSATYAVKVVVWDTFDFSSGTGSISKELASLLGSFLFREFEWESTLSFNLTVPNPCNHIPNHYHFVYDSQEKQLQADHGEGYTVNTAEQKTFEHTDGTRYYFELDRPINLYSDQPWVMEYSIKKPKQFGLAKTEKNHYLSPALVQGARSFLLIYTHELDDEGIPLKARYMGTTFSGKFSYNTSDIYTLRLENVIAADGSNMLYLTVRNQTSGETVMDRVAMDDCYISQDGKLVLESENDPYISGLDFQFNYIGNVSNSFGAEYYDLKVWEKGPDLELDNYLICTVTKSTCTEKGYTTHTGPDCGYSFRDTYVPALGHSFGDWTVTQNPACENKGTEKRICVGCGREETRDIAAFGHDYEQTAVDPGCMEKGYTLHTCSVCNDSYTDSETDALGHSYGQWVTLTEPDCTTEGSQQRDCAACDSFETQTIPMIGHTYEAVITSPNCTAGGYTTYTCACGDHYISDETEMLGHEEAVDAGMAAGCTEEGLTEGRHCERCGEVLAAQEVIPAVGHQYADGVCAGCGDVILTAPVLKASNIASSGKVKLSWEEIPGAVKYEVWWATAKNGVYKRLITTRKTSVTNISAVTGKTYYYYVVAVDENGNRSAGSTIVTRTCDLAQPVIEVSNRASDGAVKIKWEKIEGATRYEVWRAASRTGKYTRITTTSSLSCNNTSTTAGQIYYYKVRAICDKEAAASAYSDVKYRTRDLAQPDVKVTLKSGKPYLSWNKVTNAISYKVYRATSKDGTYKLVTTTTNRYYKDAKATQNKTYSYKVVAVCKKTAGNSAYSGIVSIKSKSK